MCSLLFNHHLTMYLSNYGFNYNNILGFILLCVFVVQFSSGLLLTLYYSSHSVYSFSSIFYLSFDVSYGFIVRLFHVVGSFLFIFALYFHFLRALWYVVSFSFEVVNSHWFHIYLSGLVILLASLAISFLGYTLVWGQMSYWGIQVIVNVLTILPSPLHWLLVDLLYSSSSLVLFRFFILHFALSFVLIILIASHVLLLHVFSSSSPLFNLSSSFVLSFSLMIVKDFFLFALFYLSIVVYVLLFNFEFLSNPINNVIASSLSTPLHILPESYFLIFYALLRNFPSKLFGVLIVLSYLFYLLVYFKPIQWSPTLAQV